MKKRSSFLDRLSGNNAHDDAYDRFDDDFAPTYGTYPQRREVVQEQAYAPTFEEESTEGQLPVDVFETANEIVIRTFVAGVRPDELNVSISRDSVTLEGSREEREGADTGDYITRELFWGSFSRTIALPQEIDVDASIASAKDGLLTLTLPKMDRSRQTKLRVKIG